ncbi:hypothetical protein Scep_023552 [Stephania cephalantha]|uniref:Carboxypeptidase n=1 Tax=Stephania cephalantha TaxID=152367 RepID=A0AAP0HWD4_9MAGN
MVKGMIRGVVVMLLISLALGVVHDKDLVWKQEKDRVTGLPGLTFDVNFSHYSGYVRVNENPGRFLFYWFFEAVEDPSSKPLVLWLQGGPGCSSIGFGEAVEIGPFHINADGKTLYLNPYSWNQVANIIFLESPVGTGFSYSRSPSDVEENGDERTAKDSLAFLLEWFERFPQYKGREFYITGESYAGHYIPQLSQAIDSDLMKLEDIVPNVDRSVMQVGNALTDDFNDHKGVREYLWSNGFISDQTYKLYKIFCSEDSFLQRSENCKKISDVVQNELGKVDIYSIFTPYCTSTTTDISFASNSPQRKFGQINETYDPCSKNYAAAYFNVPEVQKALHVDPEAAPHKWEICNRLIFNTWKDSASSVLDVYRELIRGGLRIWIYSGDADTVIPVTSTRCNIDTLNLPIASPWHPWSMDGQVGGWNQEYRGLNFVTIRGAGHMVPQTRPKEALVLFKSFLSGTPLPTMPTLADTDV